MTATDVVKKEFSAALTHAVTQLLGSQLDGPFSMIIHPPGYDYRVQYGSSAYYNTATFDVIDQLCTKDINGIVTLTGNHFSMLYQTVLQNVVYGRSTTDREKLKSLGQQFTVKEKQVISAFESAFEPITPTQIVQSQCHPSTPIGYIQQFINVQFSGNPQNIDNAYAAFRTTYQSWLLLGDQMGVWTSRQSQATDELKAAIQNTISPSNTNGGWQTSESSYAPAYTGFPEVTTITGSLTSANRELTVPIQLKNISAAGCDLSIAHRKPVSAPRSAISIDLEPATDIATSQSLECLSNIASQIDISISYPGVTILQANPKNLSSDLKTGWYEESILSEIVENTGRDATGFRLQGTEFSIKKLFGPGKTFARVKTFVISQEPTIEITFFDSDKDTVMKALPKDELLHLNFSDFSVAGYSLVKTMKGKTVVTLAPGQNQGTIPADKQKAHIIGGIIAYPASNSVKPSPRSQALTSHSSFSLQGEDGRYISVAEFGDSLTLRSKSWGQRAYWPKLAGNITTFRIINQHQLRNNFVVKIITNEVFKHDWQDYNLIGTFLGGVYYWNDYGSQSNWRITKVKVDDSSTSQICVGDTISLWNEDSKKYLAPGIGDYLTTKDSLYTWTIKATIP